jgi:hypothetical protein
VFGYTEPVGRDGSVGNLMFHFLDTDTRFGSRPICWIVTRHA